jgi:hypothetical protein
MRTMRIGAGTLVAAVLVLLAAWPTRAQLADTAASVWMQLERNTRTAYVVGFLSGIQYLMRSIG